MTWGELLKQGQERLKKAGIQEYELDAWYLFEQAFSMSRARYFLDAKEEAAPEAPALKAYEDGLERRSGRVPLQHILGTQEFMGMEFFVNAHVLIPRQDTETLVETVLNEQKNRNISVLDMCTGSGCIAVSLKALGGYARDHRDQYDPADDPEPDGVHPDHHKEQDADDHNDQKKTGAAALVLLGALPDVFHI